MDGCFKSFAVSPSSSQTSTHSSQTSTQEPSFCILCWPENINSFILFPTFSLSLELHGLSLLLPPQLLNFLPSLDPLSETIPHHPIYFLHHHLNEYQSFLDFYLHLNRNLPAQSVDLLSNNSRRTRLRRSSSPLPPSCDSRRPGGGSVGSDGAGSEKKEDGYGGEVSEEVGVLEGEAQSGRAEGEGDEMSATRGVEEPGCFWFLVEEFIPVLFLGFAFLESLLLRFRFRLFLFFVSHFCWSVSFASPSSLYLFSALASVNHLTTPLIYYYRYRSPHVYV